MVQAMDENNIFEHFLFQKFEKSIAQSG